MRGLFLCILVIILFFNFSCKDKNRKQNIDFGQIPCNNTLNIPEYDYVTVTILNREKNISKDTVIRKIKKNLSIFKPCKKYIYKASYYDKKGDLLSDNQILIMSTGKKWKFDQNQDEAIIQYQFSLQEKERILNYFEKNNYPFYPWQKYTKTGIKENVEEVWIHPFRSNQYIFTEIAPFPSIEYPIKINEKWYSSLNIGEGWDIWSNTSGRSTYEVVSQESLKLPFFFKKIDCYKIEAKARYDFGTSYLTFFFSEKYGFVKKEYLFYTGEKLDIVLQKIKY